MAMSDAPTFSAPSSPTSGLQPYDLDRRVKSLAPGVAADTRLRRRPVIRRLIRPPSHMKDALVMKNFPRMVEALHKSVADIVVKAPADRDELLAQSFAEFEAAAAPELEKAVANGAEEALAKFADENPAPTGEEPLYKGLGCVGAVANMMSSLANQVARIKSGDNYGSPSDTKDPASDDVSALLDHLVMVGELALRAAVNEHVEVADPDEEMDDEMSYVEAPTAEDADASLILKCALPMELAKFASDPASITMAVVELGSTLLLDAGVPQETLSKVFEINGEALAKDAGGVVDDQAGAGDAGAGTPDDGSGQGGLAELIKQIEVFGRIGAVLLLQTEHALQLVGVSGGVPGVGDAAGAGSGDAGGADGGADAGAEDPNAGADAGGADAGAAGAAVADDAGAAGAGAEAAAPADGAAAGGAEDDKKGKPFGKSADAGELRKDGEAEQLRAELARMQGDMAKMAGDHASTRELLSKLAAQPAPAKGVLHTAALSKAADTLGAVGEDDAMVKLAAEIDGARTDDERNRILLKAAFKMPGVDLSALRKRAA